MCGIFFLSQKNSTCDQCDYNKKHNKIEEIKTAFQSGEGRGPDNTTFISNFSANSIVRDEEKKTHSFYLGFHRLAINGLDEISNQPIIINNVAMICNGEIYNYKELYKTHNISPSTNSDCEVILRLYLKYGIEKTLQLIHGVFAFVIIDDQNKLKRRVLVARDSYGIRPMFIVRYFDGCFGVASLLKQLVMLREATDKNSGVYQFTPGMCHTFVFETNARPIESWFNFKKDILMAKMNPINNDRILAICYNVNKYLNAAVKMRVENTDRPVACLLSGGLDSSLITALVAKYVPDPKKLNTFSIGMKGASDLSYARKVATYIGTNHHEIVVNEDEFFAAIPKVIESIESYDTTTVRASVGNYLIGKYIRENCDAKVIFNGDGSDELLGGYLYMHYAPDSNEFDKETRRLLDNIHFFDVLRSDRCISCHGLEPRTPFMDIDLIAYYLSCSSFLRNHRSSTKLPEKYILRKAFSKDNLLPDSVLWRTKEAFSDGVSDEKNSWHTIIKQRMNKKQTQIKESPIYDSNLTLEQNYYKQIFEDLYPNNTHIIPHYWMPKFIDATDCSARDLGIYKELQE